MKKIKLTQVLQIVALVCFILTIVAFTQSQNVFSFTRKSSEIPGINESVDEIGNQLLGAVKDGSPKNAFKMAFTNGASNEWGIIIISSILAIILVGASLVFSFLKCEKIKKASNIVLIIVGTLAIASFAIYLSSLGNSLSIAKNYTDIVNASLKPYSLPSDFFKFNVGGSWAYFVGIASQLIAGASLIVAGILKSSDVE